MGSPVSRSCADLVKVSVAEISLFGMSVILVLDKFSHDILGDIRRQSLSRRFVKPERPGAV